MKRLKELFVFVWALNISVVSAQTFQKMTIEEMFEMADANNRSIRTFRLAEEEAGQAVKVAKNAQLPSIDVSVSASYLGDAWLADRDFTNGENAAMQVEPSQAGLPLLNCSSNWQNWIKRRTGRISASYW